MKKILSVGAAWLFPIAAVGQTFDLTIDQSQSQVSRSTTISAPFAGAFIGDYNARSNPKGTQTIPGLFGGSGNNPINYSAELVGDGGIESAPSGSFAIAVDLDTLTVSIDGLVLDLLNGDTALFSGTVNIEYDTFHTKNPTAIYPGGFTIPLPIGDLEVTTLTATQTGDTSVGILVENGDGTFSFAATVEAELTLSATFLGEPLDTPPQVILLPLVGTLSFDGGVATLTATIFQSISESTELELDPFTDIPVALPTVLPPGGTANLLLSGTVESLSLDFTIDSTIVATGDSSCVDADINCDGSVDGADLGLLLAAWDTSDAAADLDGSGQVDGADLGLLLSAWTV
jgi:hypothetical protein